MAARKLQVAQEPEESVIVSGGAHVRDFDDRDLEQVVRLWEGPDADAATSVFSLGEVLEAIAGDHPALVATDDSGAILGAAVARVEGKRAWVMRWFVTPPARGRGVGRA